MVDTMDALVDLEAGVSHTAAVPPVRRSNSIQSDGENSNETYRSRWSDEMTGYEAIEPPLRPTYPSSLGAPASSFSSSSVSSYAMKGNPWSCASCSYQNTDSYNTTCALCGFQLTKPSTSEDDRLMRPSPSSSDRSVLSLTSNNSRVTPLSSVDSAATVGVLSPQSSSSERSILSLESLNTFLSRQMSQNNRRTASSSVDSQGSASTVKVSNTVQDHFWRTRVRPERIVEGAEGTEEMNSSEGGPVRNLHASSKGPHDIGGSLNSRGMRSPRTAAGRPIHDTSDELTLELPPSQSSPGSLRSSLTSPVSKRSAYSPPYAPSHDASLQSSFRSEVQKEYSNFEAQDRLTDVALLAPSSACHDDPSSVFDKKAPSRISERSRVLTLDDNCASATYQGISSTRIAQDEATTASEASIFVTDPTLPRERAHELKLRTRSHLTLAAVFCLLFVAIIVSMTVLMLTTKKDETASSSSVLNQDPTDVQTVVPEDNLPTSFPLDTDRPTLSPTTMSSTTGTPSVGFVSSTPFPSEQRIPLEEFVQSGLPIIGDADGDQAGTLVELANSGSILAESSKSGVVRVYSLVEESVWIQLGQDIVSVSLGGLAANPISLAMEEGRTLAVLGDEMVIVLEYNGFAWEERGAPIETGLKQEGSSVSLSADGSKLAVAVPDDGSGNGRVHVYSYDATTGSGGVWKVLGAELAGYNAQYGFDIELSDNGRQLAIGTWRLLEDSKHDGLYDARRVRVHYLSQTNSWETFGPQIEIANTIDRSTVSISLAANGNVLAACTVASCSAYMYNVLTQKWERMGNEVTGGEDVSLSFSGNSMAVGIPNKDLSGVVQIFSNEEGSWSLLGNNIVGSAFGDRTGQSVSISGGVVAIGSPGSDSAGENTGMVATYFLE